MTDLDPDAVKLFSLSVWTYKMGEQVSVMIHLGDRLGLYRALAGQGPMTSAEVAERTDLNERFVREWLLGQAAAGLIDRDSEAETYHLNPVQAAVLADEDGSLAFAAGAFRGGMEPGVLDGIADSFRTGVGITYEQQGPTAAAGLARMTGPWSRLALTSVIVPALDGVSEKLEKGAKVADIGCGGGVTLTTLANAFPDGTYIGYDPSEAAVAVARARASEMNLDNVEFVLAGGEDLPADESHDLILTFDCLHDMPRPDVAAAAIRRSIKPDGTWLVKDIRSSGSFEKDKRNPVLAMMYGFSVTSCLQSAMSTDDGMGLGTLGLHPAKAHDLTEQAGFSSFVTHDFEDAANLYYEVRV